MVLPRFRYGSIPAVGFSILLISSPLTCFAIRSFPTTDLFGFMEASEYGNGVECPSPPPADTSLIHVVMTINSEYLRGSVAAAHSVLRHASCPEQVFFNFVAAEFDSLSPRDLTQLVRSVCPSLAFKVYIFREDTVMNLISSSTRVVLENPLNYGRSYMGELLDPGVKRVVYLILVVKLWEVKLRKNWAIRVPEYSHANFTNYFTDNFWPDPVVRVEQPVLLQHGRNGDGFTEMAGGAFC